MKDEELADAVKIAAAALSRATRNAKAAGLEVHIEVNELDITTYEDYLKYPYPITITEITARVERHTVTRY